MKKKFGIVFTLCLFLFLVIGLTACGEGAVSFSLNFVVDGEIYSTVSTAGNETIALPENPTKENYSFDGWYWDNGTWNTPFTANSLLDAPLSSDMSVYAKFTYTPPTTDEHEHTYSVDWTKDETHHWHASTCGHDVVSGKAIHNWTVAYTLPATESTSGVTVYTCSVCGATKTETIPATSEGHVHTYSENWSKDENYHWHAATCGHSLEEDKALHVWDRGVITHAATETREGIRTYTCSVCGATKEETIPATGESVTTATVTFNLNGGQTSSSTTPVTVESWDKTDFFFDVEKDGFNFRGWSCNGTKVFDENGVLINDIELRPNMVFVAEYSNTAKLTITTNMPEAGEYSTGGEFAYNTEVDVFAHPNQGYAFVGWMYKNATLSNQEDYRYKMWDKDVEIVAQFKLADFKLSLSSNNAEKGLVFINPTGSDIYEVEKEKMVTYKKSVTIAAYSKTDIRFLGWFDENNVLVTTNAVQTFNMPNYDYSLTAKWDYFTISYELDGGTNNVNNPTGYTIETDTIHLLSPTKSGVVFLGWKSGEEIVTEINPALGKNVTLTATWSQSQYSISYEYNGGTASNASTYSVTTGYTLVVPTKAGYTFLGWTGSNGNVPQKYVTISAGETGNKSFVANWEIIHYNVSYTLNGGTNDARNPSVYTVEDGTISLHNPTKDHYTFQNWRFNGNTITVIDSAWLSDVVIETIWMPTAYDISYTLDGGTNNPNNPANYTVETATFTLVAPTKAGYVFLGWTGSNGNMPQETVAIENGSFGTKSYVANWEIIHYDVTYTLNGGTNDEQNPTTCTVLDSIVLNNPSRQYYTFGGWYTESGFVHQVMTLNNITSDINLYAKWTPKEYSISYTLDGGTNAPSNPNSYTVETVTFTLVAPTKAGYVFLGWTGSNGNMPQETVTIENCSYGAKAYVANWEIIHYNVSYTLNSGTNDEQNPTTCTVLDSIMLKNPSRQYYTFGGWYTESGFVHQVTSLNDTTSDVNLYAKWVAIAYTITYTLNGGTNAPSNPASYTIESDDVIINAPTRNGYSFTGWSGTDLDGLQMQFTISSGSINDRAYTANWTANEYTVIFDTVGGSACDDMQITYGTQFFMPISTKTGYILDGWTRNSDGAGTMYAQEQIVSNLSSINGDSIVFYANWTANRYKVSLSTKGEEPISYTVTFNLNGGSGNIPPQTVTATNGLTYPEIPTRVGYAFMGWYTRKEGGTVFDFSASVSKDVTVYARWTSMYSGYSSTHIDARNYSESTPYSISMSGSSFSWAIYTYFTALTDGKYTIYYKNTPGGTCTTFFTAYNLMQGKTIQSSTWVKCSYYWSEVEFMANAGDVIYIQNYGSDYNTNYYGTFYLYITGANTPVAGGSVLYKELTFGDDFTLPVNYSKAGYTFAGWFDGENGTGKQYTDKNGICLKPWDKASDVTLYAKWVAYTLTTTKNIENAGTVSQYDNTKCTAGTERTISATTNNGYKWLGWYDGEILLTEELSYTFIMPEKNIVYTAKWESSIS